MTFFSHTEVMVLSLNILKLTARKNPENQWFFQMTRRVAATKNECFTKLFVKKVMFL